MIRRCLAPWFASLAACSPAASPSAPPTLASAPVETAGSATARPVATVEPTPPSSAAVPSASAAAPREYTAEEQFWLDLGFSFNEELPACSTGWTGDGRITVRDGKITAFELVEHGMKGDKRTPVPRLKGKKIPAVPASLTKVFDKPVAVSVCVGSTTIWQRADDER